MSIMKKRQTTEEINAEKFVNAVSAKDNITAKDYLSKIVQSKCEKRFKKILSTLNKKS